MLIGAVLFWLSVVVLAWVYLGYPGLVLLVALARPIRLGRDADWPELVTVGIAVHNGAAQIGERIANIVEQSTPFGLEVIVASDGSEDETAQAAERSVAANARLIVLELPRSGQSAAQGAIFANAHGEIVVLTDVETRFAPGCLKALVAALADRRVGCSTGVLYWRDDAATDTARFEGLYWRYEQAVRAWESRAGWLTAGTGALLAVRRSLYRAVPAHVSLDQMLPLIGREHRQLVVVADGAAGSDRGPASGREQFQSRLRIATQGIESNLRMSLRIKPWNQPGAFLAIWSHKLLRWATPYIAVAAAADGVYLSAAGGSPLYLLPVVAIGLLSVAALAGYVAARRGRPVRLASFALTVGVVNTAFALAWLNVVARRHVGAWEKRSTR